MKLLMSMALPVFLISAPAVGGTDLTYKVAPRVQQLHSFPCVKCHKQFSQAIFAKEIIFPHEGISFHHMPEVRKCNFCHSSAKPNSLNLLDGVLVSYDESYKICSQCHGQTTYNWSRGMHGSLAGRWDSERTIFNCTICHGAHDPKFQPMEAKRGPFSPRFLIEKGEH